MNAAKVAALHAEMQENTDDLLQSLEAMHGKELRHLVSAALVPITVVGRMTSGELVMERITYDDYVTTNRSIALSVSIMMNLAIAKFTPQQRDAAVKFITSYIERDGKNVVALIDAYSENPNG